MDCLIYLAIFLFFRRLNTLKRVHKRVHYYMRKLCKLCKSRPSAINYHKNGKTHFRTVCDHCLRVARTGKPRWKQIGYKKKDKCERCGYTSKYPQQFDVYHIDGNLNNCRYDNLKTICANCQRLIFTLNLPWKQGNLIPDL